MKYIKKIVLMFALAGGLFLAGCPSQPLAPTGVYNGDKVLYVIDQTEDTTFQFLDQFVKYEKANAATVSPGTHAVAEKIRLNAPGYFASLAKVKAAYKAEPTPANRDKIQPIITDIQALLIEATKYFIQPTKS